MLKIIQIIFCFCVLITIASCNQSKPADTKKHFSEFGSHVYHINDMEKVTTFTVPDGLLGKRCIVYSNEKTGASHMECDDNLGGE